MIAGNGAVLFLPPPIPVPMAGLPRTGAPRRRRRRRDALVRTPADWGGLSLRQLKVVDQQRWAALVAELAAHPRRVVVTDPALRGLSADDAAGLVADLLQARPVTVVVGSAPWGDLLPLTWEYLVLAERLEQSYPAWLKEVFASGSESAFWTYNDLPAQLSKWGELVGREHVHLAVDDSPTPYVAGDLVGELVGVPNLHLAEPAPGRIGIPWAEAELIRRANPGSRDVPYRTRHELLGPTVDHLHWGAAGAHPVPLPQWAAEAAAETGRRQLEALFALDPAMTGDPARLVVVRWDTEDEVVEPDEIDLADSAHAIVTIIDTAFDHYEDRMGRSRTRRGLGRVVRRGRRVLGGVKRRIVAVSTRATS